MDVALLHRVRQRDLRWCVPPFVRRLYIVSLEYWRFARSVRDAAPRSTSRLHIRTAVVPARALAACENTRTRHCKKELHADFSLASLSPHTQASF